MTAATAPSYGNLVNGAFVDAEATFDDGNPADPTDVVARFPASSAADVDAAVQAARAALPAWRATPPVVRGRHLQALARELRAEEATIVPAITREQGKPLAESRGEFLKTLEYLEYYAALGYEYGGRLLPSARPGVELQVRREPLGVVALLTPWNVPLAIPARKLAPALLCGNTVVIKPSTETPLSCHVIAEAAQRAGLPAGVINVVHGPGATTGLALAEHPGINGISFTGSTEVGRVIARVGAERLIKVQLELGGKNASIVLDDADLDHAADQIAIAALSGSGQQCTATSRILVQRSVLEAFTERMLARVQAWPLGPGDRDGVRLGPLVSERQLRTVCEYVEVGRAEGATLLLGGGRPGGELANGWYVEATVFGDVTPEMRIAREEIFGPVIAILPIDTDEEAIAIANDSPYGLSAAVFTRSLARASHFVNELEVGAMAVNLPSAGWEVQQAFGGFKASGGSGWKEQGTEVLDFFCELKAVQILPG